ncbi:restriction endonuclease subunit S [Vibrio salinus]|uniref:restriction endonuclease subunit S n=1 Tax=Vibrio salinus TaxID=2899784 RepID=UPI001E574190|nr:restriction endonuclease subunit S [Vibrio salinus]MCE0495938.1 restriction endonuclease subunit S [Vibrio salinus]
MAESYVKGYQEYPEYKDSGVEWVGKIPVMWEVKPTFAIFDPFSKKNTDGQETHVLSLSYGNIIERDVETNFGLLPESFNTYQIVKAGDIILRLTDLQNDKRSLRVGLAKQKGIITSAYLKLATKSEIEPRFAYRLLHSYDTTKVFYGMGGGLRQSMKFEDFRRLPILLPPKVEQTQIANFLDHETARIDTLIEKQQQLIRLLKEKRQAVISHAVTKGLNPDAPMKDSGVAWLGDVPAHWEVSRLKHVANLQSGIAKGGKDLTGKKLISVPMLRVANVQDGYLNLDDVHTIQIEPEQLTRYSLKNGDVLMNEGGDNDKLGRGAIWRGQVDSCIHQNHVFAIRPFRIEPEWLDMLTRASYAKFYFFRVAKQSTNLASISATNINETPILIPSSQERSDILDFLEKKITHFECLERKCLKQINLLQERRTALISAAVTGKIDVRGWRAPEAAPAETMAQAAEEQA